MAHLQELEALSVEPLRRIKWARDVMNDWDLSSYDIQLFEAYTILGQATSRKEIRVNTLVLTKAPDHVFYDTILHEIAHHKAGLNNGHNDTWKYWCRRVGAMSAATCLNWTMPVSYKWEYYCPSCQVVTRRTYKRRPRKSLSTKICKHCMVSIQEREVKNG